MLQLEIKKAVDGVAPAPLQLAIKKAERFTIELFWNSAEDLDGHALLCRDGKVNSLDRVLSTFNSNLPLADGSAKTRKEGDKRPFKTPDGVLHHSGDARTGVGASVDEIISIDGALIPADVNEIPIFVTIYPEKQSTFAKVDSAGIRIKDSRGTVLGEFNLSKEFGGFDAVQMGTVMLGEDGWAYQSVGVGFNGNFNTILAHFS